MRIRVFGSIAQAIVIGKETKEKTQTNHTGSIRAYMELLIAEANIRVHNQPGHLDICERHSDEGWGYIRCRI